MTGDEAVPDLGRADIDALHVLDLVAPIITPTARFAHLLVVAKVNESAFAVYYDVCDPRKSPGS